MIFERNAAWARRCEAAVSEIFDRFGSFGLTDETFGLVALQERADGGRPAGFALNGDWRCYPCSVVKAFHLVHALNRIERGQMAVPDDLDQALSDMITWSSNTATNYVIDLLTETTGDTLLEPEAYREWSHRREGLNRFFRDLGWPEWDGCNIAQKLMGDTRYGREAQFAGRDGSYLNVLTPLVSARLFLELFAGTLPLNPQSQKRAEEILLRDRSRADSHLLSFQIDEFLGGGVPAEAQVWSKAGYTSWTGNPRTSYYRHDLIRIALPGAAPVILSAMTQGQKITENAATVFPGIGRALCDNLLAAEPVPA